MALTGYEGGIEHVYNGVGGRNDGRSDPHDLSVLKFGFRVLRAIESNLSSWITSLLVWRKKINSSFRVSVLSEITKHIFLLSFLPQKDGNVIMT